MCQVKFRSKVKWCFSHFGLSGRLHWLQRAQTYPKSKFLRRVLREYESHALKGQRQATNGYYKTNVTNMPCDMCFPRHFVRRYKQWLSFDTMMSPNLTFDGGQVMVKSRKVKFSYQYFCIRNIFFWLRFTSRFKICHKDSSTIFRTPRKVIKNHGISFLSYSVIKTPKINMFLMLHVCGA